MGEVDGPAVEWPGLDELILEGGQVGGSEESRGMRGVRAYRRHQNEPHA